MKSIRKTAITRLVIFGSLLVFAGCGSTGIKTKTTTKANGDVIVEEKIGADVAAMREATKSIEATAKVLEAAGKLDTHAQTAAMARGDLFTDTMKSYVSGENAEVAGITQGVSAGIMGATVFLGIHSVASIAKAGIDGAGNVTNIRDITQNGGSVGSGMGSATAGHQILSINSDVATDQGMNARLIDKFLNGDGTLQNPITTTTELDVI